MKDHPPPEATSQQTFLEDLDRQVTAAHKAGGYTAILKLAEERLDELRREFAALTAGHQLTWMTNREREELQRTWTPEKLRLDQQIAELDGQIRDWDFVAGRAAEHAANEALGWTILPDGTPAKVLDNGKVLSSYTYASQWEEDGRTYTSDGPDEQWKRRHQRHALAFGDRIRAERLQKIRNRTRPAPQRRTRERRPGARRRPASSSTTSGSDPGGASDLDGEPPSGELRHISIPLAAELNKIAEQLRGEVSGCPR